MPNGAASVGTVASVRRLAAFASSRAIAFLIQRFLPDADSAADVSLSPTLGNERPQRADLLASALTRGNVYGRTGFHGRPLIDEGAQVAAARKIIWWVALIAAIWWVALIAALIAEALRESFSG
jgi:hypothetical protein